LNTKKANRNAKQTRQSFVVFFQNLSTDYLWIRLSMMVHYHYYHQKDSDGLQKSYPIQDKQMDGYCELVVLVIDLHSYTKADEKNQ
jgi:hypothetical protein